MRGIIVGLSAVAIVISGGFLQQVSAARFTSPSYIIDASVANTFGGQGGSGSYRMVASGGESIVGTGAGGSYRIAMGYTAQLITALQVSAPELITFPALTPGSPQAVSMNVSVQTDASGYQLAISQNHNLKNAQNDTIPKIAASIGSPAAWVDGTTRGLGFSITGATGGLPGKWAGPAYASLPDAATPTTFYDRQGQFSGSDTVAMQFKLDTSTSQPATAYTNAITITGTMTP